MQPDYNAVKRELFDNIPVITVQSTDLTIYVIELPQWGTRELRRLHFPTKEQAKTFIAGFNLGKSRKHVEAAE